MWKIKNGHGARILHCVRRHELRRTCWIESPVRCVCAYVREKGRRGEESVWERERG